MAILKGSAFSDPATVGLLGLFFALVFLVHRYLQKRNKLPLPPKPPGWPIIGNTIEFINAAKDGAMHLLLAKWAREYGEIIRVQVGPVTNFYLNSDHAVKVVFGIQIKEICSQL